MLAGGGEASEEERGASGEAEGTSCLQCEEVDEDGQPDRQLDGVLGVAEELSEMQVALQPAQEQLALPPPEEDLADFGGGQAPAVGEGLVAARGWRAAAGLSAR